MSVAILTEVARMIALRKDIERLLSPVIDPHAVDKIMESVKTVYEGGPSTETCGAPSASTPGPEAAMPRPMREPSPARVIVCEEWHRAVEEFRLRPGSHVETVVSRILGRLDASPSTTAPDEARVLEVARLIDKHVTSHLRRIHDDCSSRSKSIRQGVLKSKMTWEHYNSQAMGVSHALDILSGNNFDELLHAMASLPAAPAVEGEVVFALQLIIHHLSLNEGQDTNCQLLVAQPALDIARCALSRLQSRPPSGEK